jgi:hypothetical protein
MTLAPVAVEYMARDNVVRSVSFSPDGTKIVSGSSDMSIRLWGAHARSCGEHVPWWRCGIALWLTCGHVFERRRCDDANALGGADERPQRHCIFRGFLA